MYATLYTLTQSHLVLAGMDIPFLQDCSNYFDRYGNYKVTSQKRSWINEDIINIVNTCCLQHMALSLDLIQKIEWWSLPLLSIHNTIYSSYHVVVLDHLRRDFLVHRVDLC